MTKAGPLVAIILVMIIMTGAAFAGEVHQAALTGKVVKVKAVLDKNPECLNEKDTIMGLYEWTPMHIAADRGYLDIVELLIKRGANVNEKNSDGRTPLLLAVKGDHKDIVELLILWGADLLPADITGKTPMDWAASEDMKELLIKNGVPVKGDKRGL